MNIDIYSKYKINVEHNFSVQIDYDCYREMEEEYDFEADVKYLFIQLENDFKNENFNGVCIKYNKIIIEFFDCLTGESGTKIYTIHKIKGSDK